MQTRQPAGNLEGYHRRPSSRTSSWHPKVDDRQGPDLRDILRRQAARRWLAALACVICALPMTATQANGVQSEYVSPSQMQTGSLLFRMQSGYVVATRMNTSIDARVNGLVARVSVRQAFMNDGAEWVEGVYVFPLPEEAAVDHLRMYIGDRFIEGEIREKAQARKEYEAAKSTGKKASLVEQQRANMFTTSVANVAPGETVTIEIEYLETLRYDEGTFSLRFPVTITPRYIPGSALPDQPPDRKGSGWAANTTSVADASMITPPVVSRSQDHRLTFSADLDAGVPLEFVASRYHVIDVINLGGRYHIALADGIAPMDHDLELTWKPEPASAPRAVMFTEMLGDQPHALLMMLPPDDLSAPIQSLPRELIFVIDTSGSMHGTSLEQAKRALGLALDGLHAGDRFNVIQFNSVTSALFPDSVGADARNLNIARRYVAGLKANGGTEMRPAIGRALDGAHPETHLRQVIFITDGSVGNEEELFSLIERRLGGTRLFTVGIGSAPNGLFMQKAAAAGRGTFTMIGALHEVNEKMQRLFRKLERPQVTDIVVEWPSGSDVQSYPASIPDLYVGEPIMVRARLGTEVRPGDLVSVRGDSALGTWDAELAFDNGEARSGIAALWARARIEELVDRERRGGSPEATRKAIIDTALAHHLVSKYTSLVAVDKTPVRPDGAGLASEQVPNLLPYGQSMSAIFGFPATGTGAHLHRLSGLAMIAVALFLMLVLSSRRWRRAPQERV